MVHSMLDQQLFSLGGRSITLLSLIVPVLILIATLAVAATVAKLFSRLHKRASPTNATLIYVSGQLLRYTILFGGLFATISAAGLNLSSFAFFAGALGVGIGLGLQDIVKNFTYGILLLLERSVEVGDFIELEDGTAGQVVAIGARATTINTNDNVDVLVPNAMMLSGALTNWTTTREPGGSMCPFPSPTVRTRSW
jgi:small-conductance mechanosensitive channel